MLRRRILTTAIASLASATASPASQAAPISVRNRILGCYLGNPNGSDPTEMKDFEVSFDRFVRTMGVRPAFMNTFIDESGDWASWVDSATWAAWSWSKSTRSKNLIPVIGVPMAAAADQAKRPAIMAFNAIATGKYDTVFAGIVAAWRDHGFKTIYVRPGYEMNGDYSPWYTGSTPSAVGHWRRAFRRIAATMRAVPGVSVRLIWNPAFANAESATALSYPGDDVVDVIGLDIYNQLYPADMHDWETGRLYASQAAWQKSNANRMHHWDNPGATPGGSVTEPGQAWGVSDVLAFATAHSKPVAICETGVGVSPTDPDRYVVDDDVFPSFLASRLLAKGPSVVFVNIWDVNVSDGKWCFSDGSQPKTAAAWRRAFGATKQP